MPAQYHAVVPAKHRQPGPAPAARSRMTGSATRCSRSCSRCAEGTLHVLLWQRGAAAVRGALGAARRAARPGLSGWAPRPAGTWPAKVDLTDIAHLEQLETRSDPARDPRGRVLATAYLAVVSAGVEPQVPADTAWHPVADLPPTAFDHGSIVESARDRLRAKLSYTNIGFALAPDTFTIAQLRDIYAAIARPPGVRDQPAAHPDPARGDRAHHGGRPADVAGRPPGHAVPVRRPDPGRDQPVRRVPPARHPAPSASPPVPAPAPG